MVAIGRRISGGIRLNRNFGERLPMLEQRLNALIPNALSFLRILLIVAVIGFILDAWGIFAAGAWLATETGSRALQSLISASFILVACGAIWIAVASWIEYKVTPHGGRIVRAREQTLLTLLRNAFTVLMVVMATMLTLSAIGINIAPLLAGAGVIGLAIGFGAQRLVQDIITGVFIQFENAMNAGDVVALGGVSGVVEKLTIRSVGIRDLSGTFHLVPFSSVDTVSNMTKDFAYHVAEIGIGYSDDIPRAKQVMLDAFEELRATDLGPTIIGDFDMHGVIALAESSVTLRGRIKTVAAGQWNAGRRYTEIVKRRLDEAGIEIPFPNVTLHIPAARFDAPAPRLERPGSDDRDARPILRASAGSARADRRAEHHQAQDLEQHLRPGVGGVGRGVVLRRDLDDVAADDIEPLEPAQDRLRLARRQAADLGRAGAGREGRVERVDVERQVDRPLATPRAPSRSPADTRSRRFPRRGCRSCRCRRRIRRGIPRPPRRPIWIVRVGSSTPSSTALRNGAPWLNFSSPSNGPLVSECASIWIRPTGRSRATARRIGWLIE